LNERIDQLIAKVASAQWLTPTESGDELSSEMLQRIESHVKSFGDALCKSDPEIKAPTCSVVRCAEELCNQFLSAWSTAANQKDSWRFQEALRRANAARWMESDDDVRGAQEELEVELMSSLERSASLCFGAPVKDPPLMRIARAELAWQARDDDEPSPWGPLLDIWLEGAWPVWLPHGEVLVYVPLRREEEIAWVPDSPTPWELPAVAGEMLTAYQMEWADWKFRQKDALLTIPRYRVAAAAEDLLVVFDSEWVHPYVYPLRKDEVIIGRVSGGDIIIPKGTVSKRHCALIRSDEQWFVGDAGSTGGTFLDGQKITAPTPIEAGARLTFGGMTLRVLTPGQVATVGGPLVDQQPG
jgi:hypothetical protein